MAVGDQFPKGLIEYVPIELALEPVEGEKSLFINCLWVVPPFWRKGVAKSLVKRVIKKARAHGGVTVLAYEGDRWFGYFPYMPASFFEKFGFREVDRDGSRVLLHLDLGSGKKPRLIRPRCGTIGNSEKMVVDVFFNSQRPWSGWTVERIKKTLKGSDAVVNVVNTDDRRVVERYGMARGVCVNGEPIIKRMASLKEVESTIKQRLNSKSVH